MVRQKDQTMAELSEFLLAAGTEVESSTTSESDLWRFRTCLRQYFESIPSHSLACTAAEAQVQTLAKARCFRVSVAIFIEKRQFQRAVTPYKGWRIPQLRRDENSTSVWEMNWAPPSEPGTTPEKKIIADSQELLECSHCNARGYHECQNCNSTGRLPCGKCVATGAHACKTCDGAGTVVRQRQLQKFKKCTGCTTTAIWNVVAVLDGNPYTRVRGCRRCRGTGQEPYVEVEQYAESCPGCRGRRSVRCGECHGRKVLQCGPCDGKSRITCGECQGYKGIVNFVELHRSFEKREGHAESVAEVVGDILQKGFSTPFSVGQNRNYNWSGTDPAGLIEDLKVSVRGKSEVGRNLSKVIVRLLQEHLRLMSPSEKPTAWQVKVSETSTGVVTYLLNGRKYRCLWDVVESHRWDGQKVLPHSSIVSVWCRAQLNQIRKRADEESPSELATDFKAISRMADADLACQQVVAAALKTGSLDGVAAASRRSILFDFQFIFFSLVAVLFAGFALGVFVLAVARRSGDAQGVGVLEGIAIGVLSSSPFSVIAVIHAYLAKRRCGT